MEDQKAENGSAQVGSNDAADALVKVEALPGTLTTVGSADADGGGKFLTTALLAKIVATAATGRGWFNFFDLLGASSDMGWLLHALGKRTETELVNRPNVRPLTPEQRKAELIKQLLEAQIDPVLFDSMLTNEMNRALKVRFGIAFLTLTTLVTAASYAIVILNGIYKWNISPVAITGLIIETPIQFVGLLYVIARNLFPTTPVLIGQAGRGIAPLQYATGGAGRIPRPAKKKKKKNTEVGAKRHAD